MEIQISFTIGEGIESAKSKKIANVKEIIMMGEDVPIISYKFDDVQHPNQVGAMIPPALDTPESKEQYAQAIEDEQLHFLESLTTKARDKIQNDRESRQRTRTTQIENLQRQETIRQRGTLDRVFREPPEQT